MLLSVRTRDPEQLVDSLGPILFGGATGRAERLRFFTDRNQFPPSLPGFMAQFGAIVAFANKDGVSWNLRFDYLPARPDITIQLRPFNPKDKSESHDKAA